MEDFSPWYQFHEGSMGLGYLPIHEGLFFMVNVGKYTINTWILWACCGNLEPRAH